MFRGSAKSTVYPLHSPVSPSVPLSWVTVYHHISTGLQQRLVSGKSRVISSPPSMCLFTWPQFGLCMFHLKTDVCHPIRYFPSVFRGHVSTTQHKVCVVFTLRFVTRQRNLWERNCAPDREWHSVVRRWTQVTTFMLVCYYVGRRLVFFLSICRFLSMEMFSNAQRKIS